MTMTTLEKRREQYGIPRVPYLPFGDCVLIYRLPNETRTAGGLYIPETSEEPKPEGVLLAAGLKARDQMRDGLIEVGDIVSFAKYAGWEKQVSRDPMNKGKDIIQMKIQDVLGSEDAMERVEGKSPTHKLVYDNDPKSESYGQHFYEEVAS